MKPNLLLIGALLLAIPADAQRHVRRTTESSTYVRETHDASRLVLRITGNVEFNDEGDWIEAISEDGGVRIEERAGGSDRRVEFTRSADGGVRVRFWDAVDARPLDGATRAWARETVRRAVREGAVGAQIRVPRIRARRGVQGVLDEIGSVGGDIGQRMYFLALLRGAPLTASEFDRVMADVARRIESDTETRLVLMGALEQAGAGARLGSLLRALRSVHSDTETRLVLTAALERGTLRDGPAANAFFQAVESISSDTERRVVLVRVMDSAAEGLVVGALNSAAAMRSDTEKRIVLSRVPAELLRHQRVTTAYQQLIGTMRSDSERSIALRRLAAGS